MSGMLLFQDESGATGATHPQDHADTVFLLIADASLGLILPHTRGDPALMLVAGVINLFIRPSSPDPVRLKFPSPTRTRSRLTVHDSAPPM